MRRVQVRLEPTKASRGVGGADNNSTPTTTFFVTYMLFGTLTVIALPILDCGTILVAYSPARQSLLAAPSMKYAGANDGDS
jgi:hypothetical protein